MYQVLFANIKILTTNVLIFLKMKLNVQLRLLFNKFLHYPSCLFWYKPLFKDNDFFDKLDQCI